MGEQGGGGGKMLNEVHTRESLVRIKVLKIKIVNKMALFLHVLQNIGLFCIASVWPDKLLF